MVDKLCHICGVRKPLTLEFYPALRWRPCRMCESARSRSWYYANRARALSRMKAYAPRYCEQNAEKLAAYRCLYREKHRLRERARYHLHKHDPVYIAKRKAYNAQRRVGLPRVRVERAIIDGMLICTLCREMVPLCEHYRDRHDRLGYTTRCKRCHDHGKHPVEKRVPVGRFVHYRLKDGTAVTRHYPPYRRKK